MQWTSVVAIYALLWVLSAFLVMPFGLRTPNEVADHQIGKGHADSAPVNFRPGRIAIRATILAALMMFVFYLNYIYGWVGVQDLNFYGPPPVKDLGY
jgi:predicted secreted protein